MRKTPAKEEPSDSELLQLSREGNEDAFLTLYRPHQGAVFRFALHMAGEQETAEEWRRNCFFRSYSDYNGNMVLARFEGFGDESKSSDPRMGETTYKLTNIQRSEPAAKMLEASPCGVHI